MGYKYAISENIMAALPASTIISNRVRKETLHYTGDDGHRYKATLAIRFDDQCSNGHNTFAMTVDQYVQNSRGRWVEDSFGCQHDLVAERFPEFAKYIKWHLTSTDGPMHYLANTMYQAGDRDHNGRRKGEPFGWELFLKFDSVAISHKKDQKFMKWLKEQVQEKGVRVFTPRAVARVAKSTDNGFVYADNYTFDGYDMAWHFCPFDCAREAQEWADALEHCRNVVFYESPTRWGEGRTPDLEAARHSAIWPEATLEQLNDREALEARLPALMEEFKADMEELGFDYTGATDRYNGANR